MKNTADTGTTEALLEGLIAECHSIIRDLVRPAYADASAIERAGHIHAVTDLAESAVKLGDAIGRLRGVAPGPEVRQRITVEKVHALPAAKGGKPVPQLSAPRGEGG